MKVVKTFMAFSAILIIYCIIMIFIKIYNSSKYSSRIKKLSIIHTFESVPNVNKIKLFFKDNLSIKVGDIYISSNIIIFISLVCSIIVFIFSYKILNIFSSALILAAYMFILPYQVIKYLKLMYNQKIMNVFPTYLATLKNYTKTENDILIAFRRAKPNKELSKFIVKFNNQVENGVKIFDAFEELKHDIKISKISEFITSLQYCYINGGDFNCLIDKYLKIIVKLSNQREDEKEKSLSTKIVLLALIVINIYMLFGFVFANSEYKLIITQSFVGKLIVNINILSYIIIFIIFSKISEMED